MADPRAWAIIPARGGSKGIADKNLQLIQGRSLVARAVEAARGARSVAQVFVSTDSPAIAAEARGAGIIERPAALADDAAGTEAALLHALDTLEARGHEPPALLVLVQCTSPFVSAADIDGTVAALLAGGSDTAHSVAPAHGFLWRRGASGAGEGINHDPAARQRRQDREPEFLETGAVYVMRTQGFRAARHRFFGRTVLHAVEAARALEIDTPADLQQARLMAPLLDAGVRAPALGFAPGAIVFDFDGVLTDDRVIQFQEGREAVTCSRADGLGIEMLHRANLPMLVLSREANPVVRARCDKLNLPCRQGLRDKTGALEDFAREAGVAPGRIAYVGNDLNDLECFAAVGLAVAVADAHPRVRASAGLVLGSRGGRGAVREFAELVLQRRALDEEA